MFQFSDHLPQEVHLLIQTLTVMVIAHLQFQVQEQLKDMVIMEAMEVVSNVVSLFTRGSYIETVSFKFNFMDPPPSPSLLILPYRLIY